MYFFVESPMTQNVAQPYVVFLNPDFFLKVF